MLVIVSHICSYLACFPYLIQGSGQELLDRKAYKTCESESYTALALVRHSFAYLNS